MPQGIECVTSQNRFTAAPTEELAEVWDELNSFPLQLSEVVTPFLFSLHI